MKDNPDDLEDLKFLAGMILVKFNPSLWCLYPGERKRLNKIYRRCFGETPSQAAKKRVLPIGDFSESGVTT